MHTQLGPMASASALGEKLGQVEFVAVMAIAVPHAPVEPFPDDRERMAPVRSMGKRGGPRQRDRVAVTDTKARKCEAELGCSVKQTRVGPTFPPVGTVQ